jgi:hypothetical protein
MENKMKKQTKINIVLITLVLVLGSYAFINEVVNPCIQNKVQEGFDLGVKEVAAVQTTNEIIYYLDQNQTIASMEITKLCGIDN